MGGDRSTPRASGLATFQRRRCASNGVLLWPRQLAGVARCDGDRVGGASPADVPGEPGIASVTQVQGRGEVPAGLAHCLVRFNERPETSNVVVNHICSKASRGHEAVHAQAVRGENRRDSEH